MLYTINDSIVDGFLDGEFDLPTLFAREPAKRDDFITSIIDPIVEIIRSKNSGGCLSVVGHSDRYDASSNHIQCLAVEKNASERRVESAIAHINELVKLREPASPDDLNDLPYFNYHLRAPGAGVLVNDAPSLSEAQRRQNRRIQALLLTFTP